MMFSMRWQPRLALRETVARRGLRRSLPLRWFLLRQRRRTASVLPVANGWQARDWRIGRSRLAHIRPRPLAPWRSTWHRCFVTGVVDRSAWGGEPTNDTVAATLALDGGTLVQVHLSMAVTYGDAIVRLRTEFHGDEGMLEAQHDLFGNAAGVRIRGCKRGEALRTSKIPADLLAGSDPADLISPYRLHSAGPRRFIDAILAGEPALPSFRDGVRAQEVIDAAMRSSAEGRWVELISPTPRLDQQTVQEVRSAQSLCVKTGSRRLRLDFRLGANCHASTPERCRGPVGNRTSPPAGATGIHDPRRTSTEASSFLNQ